MTKQVALARMSYTTPERRPRLGVLQAGKVLPGGDTIVFDAEAAVVAPLIGRLGDAGSLLLFFGLTAWHPPHRAHKPITDMSVAIRPSEPWPAVKPTDT